MIEIMCQTTKYEYHDKSDKIKKMTSRLGVSTYLEEKYNKKCELIISKMYSRKSKMKSDDIKNN